ncbi:hypothetical protein GEMRC1_006722 [Eukaryota sp. GEM-RC1]
MDELLGLLKNLFVKTDSRPKSQKITLTVSSWNIGDRGTKDDYELWRHQVSATLEEHQPDVLLLQEALHWSSLLSVLYLPVSLQVGDLVAASKKVMGNRHSTTVFGPRVEYLGEEVVPVIGHRTLVNRMKFCGEELFHGQLPWSFEC